jgi:hypothetical protein
VHRREEPYALPECLPGVRFGLVGAGVCAAIGAIAGVGRGAATGAIIGGSVGAVTGAFSPRLSYPTAAMSRITAATGYRRITPGGANGGRATAHGIRGCC